MSEYRIFVNILGRSRINWRITARTDFHIQYSPIFLYLANLEVLRTYLAHNDEYVTCTNTEMYKYGECMSTLIRTLLVHLFSPNVLSYSPRINIRVVPALDDTWNAINEKPAKTGLHILLFRVIALRYMQKCVLHATCIRGLKISIHL